jgi:hypothetical protein
MRQVGGSSGAVLVGLALASLSAAEGELRASSRR